jgi:hypothetical protein
MASSAGVAMLVSTAAASSNGRFAGSSGAELEEWLVRTHIQLYIFKQSTIATSDRLRILQGSLSFLA